MHNNFLKNHLTSYMWNWYHKVMKTVLNNCSKEEGENYIDVQIKKCICQIINIYIGNLSDNIIKIVLIN